MRNKIHELVIRKDLRGLRDLIATFPWALDSCDRDGRRPIHLAASRPVVDLLLKAGAAPNVKDNYGHTPLFYCESPRNAETLVSHGANVNATRPDGWTPLFMAVYTHNVKMAKYFIDNGAYLSHRALDGTSLLHLACDEGKVDMVRLIFTYPQVRKLINAPDADGFNPLHLACMDDHRGVARLLLEQGANPHARTPNGITACDFAVENKPLLRLLTTFHQPKKTKRF